MRRVPVSSSNVAEVGYDPESETLEVAFNGGSVYQYFNVPSTIHAGLMAASSVGRYLNVHIKKAGYVQRKISE